MDLSTSLSHLPGIGQYLSRKLAALELITVQDLIYHFPFRYDDFSNVSSAMDAQVGEKVTLIGDVWSIKNVFSQKSFAHTRSRKVLTQAVFNDGSSPITLTWFNQAWLTKQIMVGDKLQISGKLSKYKESFTIVAPVWEKFQNVILESASVRTIGSRSEQNQAGSKPQRDSIGRSFLQNNNSLIHNSSPITQNSIHTGRLVPVYPETEGLTSKWIRGKIAQLLPQVKSQTEDPLPQNIRGEMLELKEAIEQIHFPDDLTKVKQAQDRLGFDELFYIQLATQKTRSDWKQKPTVEKFEVTRNKIQMEQFIEKLPFALTGAQRRVVDEILEDLQTGQPMNRLVQGEVGSGKTVVAAVIAYLAYLNNLKTLYMAPTEILAFQHSTNLSKLLSPYGIEVGTYTGSRKYNKNSELITLNSSPHVIVGTHALLSEKLAVDDIGLIIIDEQQRFGVEQRTILRNKAKVPHFLTMTATPIPRTVALTLYGDLDLSIIDELPVGRIPIKTHLVPNKKRPDAYRFIAKKIKENGDQVYLITPLIELSESLVTAKAATVEYEKLSREVFPDLRLGLLHGRLKPKEKDQVLTDFKDQKYDILVSTSVVEVGVDVPNATIMVIEGAERFGLAQLHQLRGRIGRGEKESFCLLFTGQEDPSTMSRLKKLETISDGLKLAELDLKIRGSGQIFGKQQSGRFELKIASLTDLSLIEKTRTAASKILSDNPSLDNYPALKVKLAEFGSGVMPD